MDFVTNGVFDFDLCMALLDHPALSRVSVWSEGGFYPGSKYEREFVDGKKPSTIDLRFGLLSAFKFLAIDSKIETPHIDELMNGIGPKSYINRLLEIVHFYSPKGNEPDLTLEEAHMLLVTEMWGGGVGAWVRGLKAGAITGDAGDELFVGWTRPALSRAELLRSDKFPNGFYERPAFLRPIATEMRLVRDHFLSNNREFVGRVIEAFPALGIDYRERYAIMTALKSVALHLITQAIQDIHIDGKTKVKGCTISYFPKGLTSSAVAEINNSMRVRYGTPTGFDRTTPSWCEFAVGPVLDRLPHKSLRVGGPFATFLGVKRTLLDEALDPKRIKVDEDGEGVHN